MRKSHAFLHAASVLALGVAASGGDAQAQGAKKEKCFGIVKAGKNDCAATDGSHNCAGYSKKNASGVDWILLPAGTCERIVDASPEPTK